MVTSVCAWLDFGLAAGSGRASVPVLVRGVVRCRRLPCRTSGRDFLRVSIGSQLLAGESSSEGSSGRACLTRMHYKRRGHTARWTEGEDLRTSVRRKPRRPWACWVAASFRQSRAGLCARALPADRQIARSGCWPNGTHPPVLKHGPRSLTYMRVFGWFKPVNAQ